MMVINALEGAFVPEGIEIRLGKLWDEFRRRCDVADVYGLEVMFVSEKTIRDLNRNYLGKDRVTDVLSFPMDPVFDGDCFGAIYLCKEDIAKKYEDWLFGVCYLFVHGLLHLRGYDHGEEMFRLQEEIVDVVWIRRDV